MLNQKIKILYILPLLLSISLFAKTFSYTEIHNIPTSVEKDYYIWCYLKQSSTNKFEAKKIIYEISHSNKQLKKAYKKKTGETIQPKMIQSCKPIIRKTGIVPMVQITNRLSKKERVLQKQKNKLALKRFRTLKSHSSRWQKASFASEVYVFNHISQKEREKYFDKTLSKETIHILESYKHFGKSVRLILDEKLPKLQQSLLYTPLLDNRLSALSHFKLGLHAIEAKKYNLAQNFFYHSAARATKQWDQDKANFWSYLLSENEAYVDKLLESTHVNIYTLLAQDIRGINYAHINVPHFTKKHKPAYDSTDPLAWRKLKTKINQPHTNLNALAEQFKYEDTVGIYSFIKAQAQNYTTSYFPMPYRQYLKHLPKKRQAILYALARQETRFVPASISPAFALGMMQFMPFLIKDIAKKKGDHLNEFALFKPKKALEYGEYHLSYLSKYLQHPLFIAYAYNGGIGFTRKLLRDKNYFRKGKFEPYLSMERMTNIESREYGKRILVNYVIYMNQLGVKTHMTPLIETLVYPSKTDKFR